MKVGIIRCQQTEDMCAGTKDFVTAAAGKDAFASAAPVEIIGFVSCGGCPGKRAVARAKWMRDRGAEAVYLASCIKHGTPIGLSCPHYQAMYDAIVKKLEGAIPVIDWTHN